MSSSQADQFRAEGNALFAKKNFAGAYKKYSEALKHASNNPVLYSNRAACCLSLNRFLDASADATKATEIDPGYAKAWARLAAATMGLGRVDQAIDAWERALGTLPAENLTDAEQKQKDQYSSELEVAKAKLEDLKANPRKPKGATVVGPSDQDKLPWKRARAVLPDLAASQTWDSSAWVIERAYSSWERAVTGIKEGHMRRMPTGPIYVGRLGVIEDLSNALIEDSRIFHIADQNLLSKYNQQVCLEVSMTNAWAESGSSQVMQEAPKRLEAEGWDTVRPALSVTVRGWVIRAFFEDCLRNNVETALEFYNSAIEVLEWGAERWKDTPSEDKGAIFQPTVARGIKCLRLDALLKACKLNLKKYPYEELLASADDILSELEDAPHGPHVPDIAFFLSFFRYPIGKARSVRAFCLLNMAKRAREANGGLLTEDNVKQYMNASTEYLEAALSYPNDDENHSWFLHCAYHAQYDGGSSVQFLLLILDRLERSTPMMKTIWGVTPQAAMGRDKALEADLEAREKFRRALDAGEIEMDSLVVDPRPGTAL